jgi:hypothetical protein
MSNILIPELRALVGADRLPAFVLVRNLRYIEDFSGYETVLVEGDVIGVDGWSGELEELLPDDEDFGFCLLRVPGGGVECVDSRTGDVEMRPEDWWEHGVSYTRLLLAPADTGRLVRFIWSQIRHDGRTLRDLLSLEDRISAVERNYMAHLVLVTPAVRDLDRDCSLDGDVWTEVFDALTLRARALLEDGDDPHDAPCETEDLSLRWTPPATGRRPAARTPDIRGGISWMDHLAAWQVHSVPAPNGPWVEISAVPYPNMVVPELRRAFEGGLLPRCFLVRNVRMVRPCELGDFDWIVSEQVFGIVGGDVIDEDTSPGRLLSEAYGRLVGWARLCPLLGVDGSGDTWTVINLVPPDPLVIARWVIGHLEARTEALQDSFRLRRLPNGDVECGWDDQEAWFDNMHLATSAPLPIRELDDNEELPSRIVEQAADLVLAWATERLLCAEP